MTTTISMPVGFIEALSSAETEFDILDACGVWIREIIGVARGSFCLREGDRFRVVTFHGHDIAPETYLEPLESLSEKVCRTGETEYLIAPDHGGSKIIKRLFDMGYRSVIMTPLVVGNTIVGTLNCSSLDVLSPEDVDRARALGRWIGSQILVRQYAREMETLAMVDAMTRLPNRRAFMSGAEALFEAFLKGGAGLAAVLFDIDNFKSINDRYGHQAGDMVLRQTAKRVAACLPDTALLGRIGGEEFGILLPDTGIGAAVEIAESSRLAISASPVRADGQDIRVTASFGCDLARADDTGIDDFLRRADNALYAAKAAGRDRVVDAA